MVYSKTISGTAFVEDGFIRIFHEPTPPEPLLGFANGLVVGQTAAAIIATGINTGYVRLSIAVHDVEQPLGDADGWDEIVDVSISRFDTPIVIEQMTARADLELVLPTPGPHRVRVYARNRDEKIDGVSDSDDPTEAYQVMLWPHERQPEVIHKQVDQAGAGLREATRRNVNAATGPTDMPQPPERRRGDFSAHLRMLVRRDADTDADGSQTPR